MRFNYYFGSEVAVAETIAKDLAHLRRYSLSSIPQSVDYYFPDWIRS